MCEQNLNQEPFDLAKSKIFVLKISIKLVPSWKINLLHLVFLNLFSLKLLKYPYFQNYFYCDYQI